jgi:Rrf2 family protein
MIITAHEEYGLRILIRIARCKDNEGPSILALSQAEGLTKAYITKLTRLLRKAGYIKSTPGNVGVYVLARPAKEIIVNQVLKSLCGALFSKEF